MSLKFLLISFWSLLLLQFLHLGICKAQTANTFQNVINVSTVSPDAASLGRFGNVPVSYTTGVANITIPVFEIHAGKINIPIALDYHSGGVRVDEVASSVGLSWALSGIGILSRNMIGLPDENTGGFTTSPSLDQLYNYFQGTMYGPTTDKQLAKVYLDVRDGVAETEQDVFSYNLNRSGGKFLYRQDGTILQIPVTNNRIEKDGSNFKVTDPNGIIYIFDQKETTNMVTASGIGPGTYTSAWRLSKMIDQNMADTVYFNYDARQGSIERTWNFTYSFGIMCNPNAGTGDATTDITGEKSSLSQLGHYNLYPKEITWKGGKVVFKNVFDSRTDRVSEGRLDSVIVYSKLNGAYTKVKSVKLHQSYFFSSPVTGKTPDYRNYRLRLDSVSFLSLNGADAPQRYRMTYNNSPIAPNESFGQDIWGFNNGQFDNPSLMPIQTIFWGGLYNNVGEAHMDPDSVAMQACMIQSIQYPTKGKSVFEFEPHRYPLNYATTLLKSIPCDAYGSVQQMNQTTFTVAANQTAFRYTVFLSKYNYSGVTDRPRVYMTDQTTGTEVFRVTNMTPDQDLQTPTAALSLAAGHTYVITANIYTANANVKATSLVSWLEPTNVNEIKIGGGLRVKSVTNYDLSGAFINKELYDYGPYGTLVTPASYLLINYEVIFSRCSTIYAGSSNGCITWETDNVPARIYHAKSIYPATQFSGSVVAYGGVTKYDVNASGQPNGKTDYQYNIYEDNSNYASTDYGTVGVLLTNNTWKSGTLRRESVYKSTPSGYSPVSIKEYTNSIYRVDSFSGLKIKVLYQNNSGDCGAVDTVITRAQNGGGKSYFFPSRVPNNTGAVLVQAESDTTFDDAGNKFVTVKNNYYDDLTHIFPTKTETFNSRSETLTNIIKYPHDLASGTNVYQKMLTRNIVSPTVKFQQLKNGSQLALANINYNDWFGNSNLLLPQTVDEQVLSAPIETRTKFNKYDAYGNILEQQKTNAPVSGYKWGYYSQYPIAVAANAASTEFYYEGFEESTAASVVAGTAHTGLRFYNGAYTVSWTRPNARNYVISYWYRNSSGVWQYQPEAAYTAGSYALTGGTAYDDIRIYPADAQMTSYTYLPLVGMTSSTDAKGMTTYYEYDGFQRLQNIKDQNGRILKNYDYNYASEAAVWVDNTGRRCKSGSTTGEQERQETDTNPLSVTYNQTRWVSNGINTTACPLPATVYVKQTVGSTSISNGLTYNTLKFNTYSDANCTVLVNAPVSLTVNYSYVTSASYADGRTPNPVVTTTNATVTIAAGSNQATSGSIIISGCFGTADKQICYTPSTQITVQPGTGYIAVNPEI
jgi:YD repeat-containing protein